MIYLGIPNEVHIYNPITCPNEVWENGKIIEQKDWVPLYWTGYGTTPIHRRYPTTV